MACTYGADVRLWIETAVADTYAMVKGEQEVSVSMSAAELDGSSKDSWPEKVSCRGAITRSISVSGLFEFPDANGGEKLYEALRDGNILRVQLRKDGTAATSADAFFEGQVNVFSAPRTFDTDLQRYSYELKPHGKPTIDELYVA
jgi:predicted secreted protein